MKHWAIPLLHKNKPNQVVKESGNVFLMLFGAVALVGVLGASTMTILKGPVRTMSQVTKRTVAENNMMATAKITVVTVANDSINGDCDGDGTPEAYPWGTAIAGTGGGTIPPNIGVQRQDPWGNEYVYCTWDHGTDNDQTCGAGTNFAQGEGVVAPSEYAVFLFSAGPDGVYETTCNDYTGPGSVVTRTPGADDVVFGYTFDEAAVIAGGLWTEDGASGAQIARDLRVRDTANTTDTLNFTADTGDFTVAGTGEFPVVHTDNINTIGAGPLQILQNTDITGNLNVSGDINGDDIDAAGDVDVTNNLTVGGTTTLNALNITGDVDFDQNFNVDGNTTMGGTLDVTGNTTLNQLIAGDTTVNDLTADNTTLDSLTVLNNTDLQGTLDVTGVGRFATTIQIADGACDAAGKLRYTAANDIQYCNGATWQRITGYVAELGDIGDVDLTSGLSNNDVIRWNGTDWIPGSVSSFFVEQDPQVDNTLTQDALCIAGASDVIDCNLIGGGVNEVVTWDGSDWVSNTIAGIYTETDPQVDTIGAAGLFCTSDGSAIDCTTSNPTGPGAVAGRLNDFDNDTYVDVEVGATDDDEIRFGTAGTEIMRITNTGEIGIGTATPDASAMINMESTTQGLLPPRMQTVEKTAIANPATGLIVFDTDLGYYEYNNGTPGVPDWQPITPPSVGSYWTDNTTHLTRQNLHIINSGDTSTTAGLDGDGTRFFFDPDTGVLRGGTISGGNDAWQAANIGTDSFGWGTNIEVSGNRSAGFGTTNTVSGALAFSSGGFNTSSGTVSFTHGDGVMASGYQGIAFGREVQVGTGTAQTTDANAGEGNYSVGFGLGDHGAPIPRITGNETFAIFFGDQAGEDITATNVLAVEGGSLLLSNDSGTACAADKQGALRLSAAGDSLEICDFAGPANDWTALTAVASGFNDRIQDTDNNTFIDVDTSDDGLTDDIVFENNGNETMRLTSANELLFGHDSLLTLDGASTHIQLYDDDGIVDVSIGVANDNASAKADIDFFKSRGTTAAPTAIAAGHSLGTIRFQGYDGDSYEQRAVIGSEVDGAVANNIVPTALVFGTSDSGTRGSDNERMRITSAGNIGIGTATPDLSALLDIDTTTAGILGPRLTTIQKNAIVNPATGLYVFDTDLNRYQYNSGTPGVPVWSDMASFTSLWTDNTTHITRQNFHVINTGQTSTTAGLDVDGRRVFYDPDTGAFRGGEISGGNDAWQAANIGINSFAWGENAEASGVNSIALGQNADATNSQAISIGIASDASGFTSLALGYNTSSTGNGSTALGNASSASGFYSTATGRNSLSSGYASVAIGNQARAGDGVGQNNDASVGVGNYSMAFGLGNTAGTAPQVTGNESAVFFFGDQDSEDITATNVLALEGGSLLLSNDSGTACDAAKQGALRLNAGGSGLEMCDGAGTWAAYPPPSGVGDRLQDTDNNTFIDVDTSDDGLTDEITITNILF